MRNFGTIDAAFPSEPEADPEGDIVRAGGNELAIAITQRLASFLPVVGQSTAHSWYGWQVTVSDGARVQL